MVHMSSKAATLLAALLVLTSACASAGATWRDVNPGAVLDVVNRGGSDVVVFRADGDLPRRLGTVRAFDRARLAIPNHEPGTGVRLLVWSLASSEIIAAESAVPRGDGTLELVVQPGVYGYEVSVLAHSSRTR
jgi:hypothetical protein